MMIQNPVAKNLGWKSMLAWFLAVILASGMLPTTGFAEEALDPVDATDTLSTVSEGDQATNKAVELGVIEEDGINPDEPILSEYARDEDLLEPEEVATDDAPESGESISSGTDDPDEIAPIQNYVTEDIGELSAQSTDWTTVLTNNYSRAKQLAGRSTFNGYCSLAVSYELWAFGITSTREAMGNGIDAASHFSSQGTTSGGYGVSYTGGSTSSGWSPFDSATGNGSVDGFYVVSYNSTSSVYGHVSFLVIEGGTVFVAESYAYAGNPEGTGMALSYAAFKSGWSRYYPSVTGVARFGSIAPTDATPPVITNVRVSDVWVSGYTVTCTVADNAGVDRVQFPTWTAANGQDDIAPDWFANSSVTGSRNGNDWTFKVYTADHNYETGWYTTHIYAIDTAGNYTPCAAPDVEVCAPSAKAVVSNGRYVLRSAVGKRMVLDVAGRSQDNQANVMIQGWNGGYNQQFDIVKNDDWSYCIYAAHSGKAVEVYGASRALGANVSQYDANLTAAQRWAIQKIDDGTYSFRQKVSGLYLDVYGGIAANDTNVHQWEGNGGLAQKWYLVPVAASQWSVSVAKGSYAYTGGAIKPTVKVTAGGLPLTNGVDYTVSYANNVKAGTATVTVTGKGGFTGSKSASFKITATEPKTPTTPAAPARKNISTATVSRIADMAYTGSAIRPSITVRYGNTTLRNGTHYTLSYSNNVQVGTATVIVKGKGDYTGTKSVTFKIVKAANPMSAKAVKRTVKHKNVKKNPVAVSRPISVSNPQGRLSYAKVTKGSSKRLTVNKTNGKVTVKKGTKKGTYTIKIKVTASGNANYKSKSTTVTCKVVVK